MTRVTNLAADMTERIQSNRQRVLDYHNTNTGVACAQSVSTQRMALGDCTQWQTLVETLVSLVQLGSSRRPVSIVSYCESGNDEPVSGDH